MALQIMILLLSDDLEFFNRYSINGLINSSTEIVENNLDGGEFLK